MKKALPDLISTNKAFCIAPAGAGKTEIIIDLCAYEFKIKGKQLILTHTHAGVQSIKKRVFLKGYTLVMANVNTIDSFCLEWVYAYPQLSGLNLRNVTDINWPSVRTAFLRLIKNPHIQEVISLRWKGLIVDEYQDCGMDQHNVILCLSSIIPTRIFGDPLQGIFDFDGSRFDWDKDVGQNFIQVPVNPVPARWMKTAPNLGKWLLEKRKEIISTGKLSFTGNLPQEVIIKDSKNYRESLRTCSSGLYNNQKDSHLIIHHQVSQCHQVARSLGAAFRSIEELEFKDLHSLAEKFDKVNDSKKTFLLLKFAEEVGTGITQPVKDTIKNLCLKKTLKHKLYKENQKTFDSLAEIISHFRIQDAQSLFQFIEKLPRFKIFRRECWYIAKNALRKYTEGIYPTFREAVTAQANQYRYAGRFEDQRTIGRIRLVKGLEFDHVYILYFHKFLDPREAYVALTRAKKTLTIFTDKNSFTYSNHTLPRLLKHTSTMSSTII